MDSTGLPQSIFQPLISTTYNRKAFLQASVVISAPGTNALTYRKSREPRKKKTVTFIIRVGLSGSLYSNGLWNNPHITG